MRAYVDVHAGRLDGFTADLGRFYVIFAITHSQEIRGLFTGVLRVIYSGNMGDKMGGCSAVAGRLLGGCTMGEGWVQGADSAVSSVFNSVFTLVHTESIEN